MRRYFWITGLLFCLLGSVCAQDKSDIKFGKVSPADFTISSPVVDTNANAVVLSDIGSSEFEGNNKGWFTLVFKRHRRIKIINTGGFDAGDVSILLYSNGKESEKLDDLKAVTYNLENGSVVATKFDRKNLFEEKVQKHMRKKFTFPALKAGSIIEYSYTIKSDFLFNLQPWEFQGPYPTLSSVYDLKLPEFFVYLSTMQGYLVVHANQLEARKGIFTVREPNPVITGQDNTVQVSCVVNHFNWALQDVPALKEESFTSSVNNHIAKLEFQLSKQQFSEQDAKDVMATWPQVAEKLLEREDFGKAYIDPNSWLDDELKTITKGATGDEEKAKKIYAFVRDNFSCSSTYGIDIGESNTLRSVFNKKSGSVSELNLLLIAMLRHENIGSEPVLMSLRQRGVVHPRYPLMDRFNYLVCQVELPSGRIFLDAARPRLGFGKLHLSAYNGLAWVITASPYSVKMSADSVLELRRSQVVLTNNTDGSIGGSFHKVMGYSGSYDLREKLAGMKVEDYTKEIKKGIGEENIQVSNIVVDSLAKFDEPVKLKFDMKLDMNDQDIIYFSPLLGEAMKKNPFTAAARLYPVEMPYAFDDKYVLDMDVPKGYKVDEMPQAAQYKFKENQGSFDYVFSVKDQKIHMECRMMLKKANFSPKDYSLLREFYSAAIKKQSEQIVFKKIKS